MKRKTGFTEADIQWYLAFGEKRLKEVRDGRLCRDSMMPLVELAIDWLEWGKR